MAAVEVLESPELDECSPAPYLRQMCIRDRRLRRDAREVARLTPD